MLTKGQHASRTIKRASILRQSNLGFQCKIIIVGLHVSASTVSRTRSKYRKNGLQSVLHQKKRSGRPTKISLQLRSEVRLLACSPVPSGRCKWTGDLLLEQGIKKYHWLVSRSTIYRILSSDDLKPWTKQEWCISIITPRYLEAMYNVLTTYEQEYDPQRPVVCVDELSKQVESSLVPSDPMVPGKPLREDYSYHKKVPINFFVAVEPKAGKRVYLWSYKKTGREFAYFCYYLVFFVYPTAQVIELVADNFTTHKNEMFFRYLDPYSATLLCLKIKWVFTPPHGSWLNMAENENNVFLKQCLNKRFDSGIQMLESVMLYLFSRNEKSVKINWSYTVSKATIKFPGLAVYQPIHEQDGKEIKNNFSLPNASIVSPAPFPDINIHFIQENFNYFQERKDMKLFPAPGASESSDVSETEPVTDTESQKGKKNKKTRIKTKSTKLTPQRASVFLTANRSISLQSNRFPNVSAQYKWNPKSRLHWVDRTVFEFIKLTFLIPLLAVTIKKECRKNEFTVSNVLKRLLDKNLIIEVHYCATQTHSEYIGYLCNYFCFSSYPP